MLRLPGGVVAAWVRRRLLLLCAAALLGGCAEAQLVAHTAKELRHATSAEAEGGQYKVGRPYQIGGVWYYPKVDYAYSERGIASWYGPGFHGRRTANGEFYDQRALTAAHRTLPLPSLVRVTNLENGRQIKLRVNDRGPFAHGRIIDVSERAAELLDFKAKGTAKVKVEIIEGESRRMALAALGGDADAAAPAAAPSIAVTTASLDAPGRGRPAAPRESRAGDEGPSTSAAGSASGGEVVQTAAEVAEIYIQAGAFRRYDNASRLRARLSELAPARIAAATVDRRQYFRVRLGPVKDVADADRLLALLMDNGYTSARVVID